MNLCDNNHGEVCYSGHNCPACEAIEEVDALEGELETAEGKIEALQERIEALQNEAQEASEAASA